MIFCDYSKIMASLYKWNYELVHKCYISDTLRTVPFFSNETLRQLLFMDKAGTSGCTMASALAKFLRYSLLFASTNLWWPEAIIANGHNGNQKHYSHNAEECKCIISWPSRIWYVALLFKKFWNRFATYLCLLARRKLLLSLVLFWPPRTMNGSHMWSLKTCPHQEQEGWEWTGWGCTRERERMKCLVTWGNSKQGSKAVEEIF